MLFQLSIPLPSQNREGVNYIRRFIFECQTSPTRKRIIESLEKQLWQLREGITRQNSLNYIQDIEVALEQLELVEDIEFPMLGNGAMFGNCNVITKNGEAQMQMQIIVPVRI